MLLSSSSFPLVFIFVVGSILYLYSLYSSYTHKNRIHIFLLKHRKSNLLPFIRSFRGNNTIYELLYKIQKIPKRRKKKECLTNRISYKFIYSLIRYWVGYYFIILCFFVIFECFRYVFFSVLRILFSSFYIFLISQEWLHCFSRQLPFYIKVYFSHFLSFFYLSVYSFFQEPSPCLLRVFSLDKGKY